MYIGIHVKYRLFLSYFHETWILFKHFRKKTQESNFMKIHPVGTELFYADRRTDRHDEASSRFFFPAILRTRLNIAYKTATKTLATRIILHFDHLPYVRRRLLNSILTKWFVVTENSVLHKVILIKFSIQGAADVSNDVSSVSSSTTWRTNMNIYYALRRNIVKAKSWYTASARIQICVA